MPIPESKIVIVLSFELVITEINKSSCTFPVTLYAPRYTSNLYFSKASEQLLRSSRKNTSLSVYIDFATISRSLRVSALNSLYSFLLNVG